MEHLEGDEPKIASWDIEISPTEGTFWGGRYETNILEITHPWVIISFSIKYLKGEQTTKALPDYKGYRKGSLDDRALIMDLHKRLSKCDILIHQNGDQFDVKKVNARFIIHNLPPVHPMRTVDTLKVARQRFGFTSNKLDDLGETLGLGRKLEHEGYPLWRKCMNGDMKAWKKMKAYNAQDVILLEKVYLRMLPFIENHPNLGIWKPGLVCRNCQSKELQWQGWRVKKTTKYHQYQCKQCGTWGHDTHNMQKIKPLV